MNILDKIIQSIDPERAAKREMSRLKIEQARVAQDMVRGYEGASIGRRTSNWQTSGKSQNAESRGRIGTLRNRARDLVRNVPFAASAVRGICNNVVGHGLQARFNPLNANERYKERLQALWSKWAESTQIDADGRCDFYGIQDLVLRTVVESGECIVRRRRRRSSDPLKLAVPIQLQVLEPDYLDESRDQLNTESGNLVIQGKEFDKQGRCVAYWLYTQHPGDYGYQSHLTNESIRVPAEDIAHIYRIDRPGQVRGVTWYAPVMIRIKDFDEYEDAQLMRQKVAACFSVFVHDADSQNSALGANSAHELSERVTPAMIEHLPPGKDISFASPPKVDGYADYSKVSLHMIATGLGIPYSLMTGDQSETNFASGRMGWIDFNRSVESWRWKMLIPQLCNTVVGWFAEAAKLQGFMDDFKTEWSEPAREMVNPKEEIAALREKIRMGYPWSKAISDMGYDPQQILEEYAEWNVKMDEAGVILDTDPRKIALTGNAHSNMPGEFESSDSGSEPANDNESDNESERDVESFEVLKANADAYGVAVRAGVITPQFDDEAWFRTAAGWPTSGTAINKVWKEEPTRRPITLTPPGGEKPAPVSNTSDNEGNGE